MRLRTPRYAATALLVGLATVGCSSTGTATPTAAKPAGTFTDSGVTVALSLTAWDGAKGTATVTLSPDKPGFHLYSTDLPPEGIDGLGRPTTVKLNGALTLAGKPTAGSPVGQIAVPGSSASLPVYPDGPVTLTVPLTKTGSGDATVLVSYAACSETEGCLLPVDDHPIALAVGDKTVTAR